MSIVSKVIFLILSFFVGGIPFAYILGRLMGDIDIRKIGSGNVGSTNLFRAVGKKGAIPAFLLDAGKGLMITVLAKSLGFSFQFVLLCAAITILGHIFSPYLRFSGGKGVATSFGVILGLSVRIAFILLFIFIVIFAASRIVSLSSISAGLAIVPLAIAFEPEMVIFATFIAILLLFTHRSNIKRLLAGAERRLI